MEVLNCWPLVLVIEDCYCPEQASHVLGAAAAMPDELIDASSACDGYAAEMDAETRQN